MIPAPSPAAWLRCARCFRRVRREHAVHGFGRNCAALLGLITPAPRVTSAPQDGPDLFDATADNDCRRDDTPPAR